MGEDNYYVIDGIKTSKKWEFSTPHTELIPQIDGKCFRKLIFPTDFLADTDFRKTVTASSETVTNDTQGWQRLKIWSYADLQYPGSVRTHTDTTTDYSDSSMSWNPGFKASETDEANLSYYLYGGITLFSNSNSLMIFDAENATVDAPEIYCYVHIPYGYKVNKSYIYVGDMRKSPYNTDYSVKTLSDTDKDILNFDGMKMKTKVLTVGSFNENTSNCSGSTEDSSETGSELSTNKVITYDTNTNLQNIDPTFNKILVIGLKYQPGDGSGQQALFESNFAVIKGGWVEFEKI
jgi:hypothetical protein